MFIGNLTKATQSHKLNLWMQRIQECKSSGQKVTDWCQENNVGIKSYYYWMRKIKQEAFDTVTDQNHVLTAVAPATHFAEVSVAPQISMAATTPAVTIKAKDITLAIHNDASPAVIKQVLLALKTLC